MAFRRCSIRRFLVFSIRWARRAGNLFCIILNNCAEKARDLKKEELDGMNSTIKPLDHRVVGDIIDDVLFVLTFMMLKRIGFA